MIYKTRYYGSPYGDCGEAGADTDNPRQLAIDTLYPGQRLVAADPDGHITEYFWAGANRTRMESMSLR